MVLLDTNKSVFFVVTNTVYLILNYDITKAKSFILSEVCEFCILVNIGSTNLFKYLALSN